MSLLNAVQFIPTTQSGNASQTYQGVDDTTNAAQFALIKAGKAGTDGVLNGVVCRFGDYGVVNSIDKAGNALLRRKAGDPYFVDSGVIGLIDHFGSPGGFKNAVVSVNLGAPADETVASVHAAITMPGADSATGIHAAVTLTTAFQTVTTGITNPSGKMPTIVGNDTDMTGNVLINYTDLNGKAQTLTLSLNGTTTVAPTLDQVPAGVDTVQSIVYPPYTVDASETVSVGYTGLVTIAGITNPDIPRCVSATGNASGITGNQVVLGTNIEGTQMLDTIALSGSSTVNGVKAFKTVTAIFTPPKVNASGDTVSIDLTDILGLPYRMDHNAVIAVMFGTVKETTAPTVTFDATLVSKNTVLLNSDPDGAKSIIVDFIRCDAPISTISSQ